MSISRARSEKGDPSPSLFLALKALLFSQYGSEKRSAWLEYAASWLAILTSTEALSSARRLEHG